MLPYIDFPEFTITFYKPLNMLAPVIFLIYNLTQLSRKKEFLSAWWTPWCRSAVTEKSSARRHALCAVVETVVLTLAFYGFGVVACQAWGEWLNGDYVNYFGMLLFAPYALILGCVLLNVDPLRQLDLITPGCVTALMVSKLGCLMLGCCHGVEWEYGFYFVHRQRREFPSQLLEILVAFGIFLLLRKYTAKNKHPGTAFPLYVILYCFTRFFTEFTRAGDVVFMGLQFDQLQCFFVFFLGSAGFLLMHIYGSRISQWWTNRSEQYIARHLKK